MNYESFILNYELSIVNRDPNAVRIPKEIIRIKMEKEIKYTGITTTPSDYESPDGDLTPSLNLLNEHGSLSSLATPLTLFTLPDGWKLECIHAPAPEVRNYIFLRRLGGETTQLWYIPASLLPEEKGAQGNTLTLLNTLGKGTQYLITTLTCTPTSIQPIGMTLIVLSPSPLRYLLWKADIKKYKDLGAVIPRPQIEFALHLDLAQRTSDGQITLSDPSTIQTGEASWDQIRSASLAGAFDKEEQTQIITYRYNYVEILRISLKKGKEYRVTLNRFNNKYMWIRIYSQVPVPGYYNDNQPNLVLSFSESESKKTFIATEDISDLYCYVFCPWGYQPSSSDPISLIIEQGIEERVEIQSKIITYTPEAVNAVGGIINAMINEEATVKNRFIYPFFVRYALRLYDGSNIRASAPCLMIPNSDYVPAVFFRSASPKLQALAFVGTLEHRILSLEGIEEWKDIVTGIDFFVSPSAWPYDQGEEYDADKGKFEFIPFLDVKSFGIGRITHNNVEHTGGEYRTESLYTFLLGTKLYDTQSYEAATVRFGARVKEEFMEQFYSASMSNFYRLASIELKDLQAGSDFAEFDIPDGALSSLLARPRLEETYTQYEGFAGAKAHTYNNRLHLFDTSVILPAPQSLAAMNSYSENREGECRQEVYVVVSTSQGERVVKSTFDNAGSYDYDSTFWFFYPDSRATKAIFIFRYNGTIRRFELPLTAHPFLTGAYAITPGFAALWSDQEYLFSNAEESESEGELPEINNSLAVPSSIYVSEVNNPFVFPLQSVATVGATRIDALSSAARALSQGQFGQFPLYAFTDTGIWALSVSDTGVISARQPITRDICTRPQAITQIDSAVVFPSARGVMLLSGSQVQTITDNISAPSPISPISLPAFDKIMNLAGIKGSGEVEWQCNELIAGTGSMIYDYIHQRIHLFAEGKGSALVYSLRTGQWGMTQSAIDYPVSSYPEALAVDCEGNLLDFSRDSDQIPAGLVLTRPIKAGAPDILKTVTAIMQRGLFPGGSVKTILYGSRDLIHWHLIQSSSTHRLLNRRGTPWKYFRIALIARLREADTISGATIQFTPRLINRLR